MGLTSFIRARVANSHFPCCGCGGVAHSGSLPALWMWLTRPWLPAWLCVRALDVDGTLIKSIGATANQLHKAAFSAGELLGLCCPMEGIHDPAQHCCPTLHYQCTALVPPCTHPAPTALPCTAPTVPHRPPLHPPPHAAMLCPGFRAVFGLETNIDVVEHHGSTDPLIVIKVLMHHGIPREEVTPRGPHVKHYY